MTVEDLPKLKRDKLAYKALKLQMDYYLETLNNNPDSTKKEYSYVLHELSEIDIRISSINLEILNISSN